VCRLRRALYGLKQAPRVWFAKFSSPVSRLGFSISSYDSTLFLRRIGKRTILLLLYVDDLIITGDDLSGIQELKDFLSQIFEMKDLGHLSYFWVLRLLPLMMVSTSLKTSTLPIFCLELALPIIRLLIHRSNLMRA
jgi:hypothetical protein